MLCFIERSVRKESGVEGEGKRERRETIQTALFPQGVFICPPCNPNKKTQPLRNSHIEDDTCGWLTTCFLGGLRSDRFIVSVSSECF